MLNTVEIYNREELNAKYGLGACSDEDVVFKLIGKKGVTKIKDALDEIEGVYAFAYKAGDETYLCRDLMGVKPLWYSTKKGFAYAAERKELIKLGHEDVTELNPREIMIYNTKEKRYKLVQRPFFEVKPETKKGKDEIIEELTGLTLSAVAKRIPDSKFGILFSGGIDSTLIAKICKDLGADFTCYTAALESDVEAEDLAMAKKVAKQMGFELKTKTIKLDEVESYLKKLVPLIEDSNVVKVGVGLTFYVACELAKKDDIKVIFSGLGSEELFAGYERHRQSADVNEECVAGLLSMHERDTYRDAVVTAHHGMALSVPFLDSKLADYSLKIPAKYKLDDKQNKKIIREVAEKLGVPSEFAQRKKRAAQYGSRFDKAIEKLAAKSGMKSKSAYLDRFYSRNPALGVMFSSGKDSCYAMWVMMKQNYPVRCLITLKSKNPDSYMFHTPNIHLAELQSRAMNIPIILQETEGEKEKELDDLRKALERAKKEYGVEGIVTGALYSQYQRERIEKVCDSVGLKVFSPLWHLDQEKEMRQLLEDGFEFIFSSVAAEGLDKSWLGRKITAKDIDKLALLNKKVALNIAGEGGEFESLVIDGPMFKKRIKITDYEIKEESQNTARFVVKKAELENK